MMFACVIEQCISSFISVGIHRDKGRGSNKEHLWVITLTFIKII